MLGLVKQGFGFALIREGTVLDAELTTPPVAGVDWTVDTAFIYKKQGHPKTVPMLIRLLKAGYRCKHLKARSLRSLPAKGQSRCRCWGERSPDVLLYRACNFRLARSGVVRIPPDKPTSTKTSRH
jgi:hypothetical protein